MRTSDREGESGAATFGALLREFRLAAGLSQEALAERARMSPGGVSVLERGIRRAPYRETVALLAEGLALSSGDRDRLEAAAARPAQPRRRGTIVTGELPPRRTTNLPSEPTRCIGRDADAAEIVALLGTAPLVTLVGPGGVGKTRLAVHVACRLRDGADAGVWLIDLAPLADPSSVAAAIAQTLGVPESPERPVLDAVIAQFARRTAVLVVDNCEHVIDEVARAVDALVRGAPRTRILATSREPLKIAGEQVYRLHPLRVPTRDEARGLRADAAPAFGAVALFAERAHAVDHRFALTDASVPTVAEICRRLDGIPLAIELAAVRIGVLPLRALADGLDHYVAILAGGERRALPRQQTMRAVIDWSYDLLTPPQQHLFEQLSVFAGGCALAEATRVRGVDETEDAVLDLLASLVDKSLVAADLDADEPRYSLLESSRLYAREKLALRGEIDAVAHRHAHAYHDLAMQIDGDSDLAAGPTSLARGGAELDNMRAALAWALRERHDVVLGQRLAGALRPVWVSLAPAEGRRWVRLALEAADATTPRDILASLEMSEARIAQRFAETRLSLDAGERALAHFRALGDARGIAGAQRTVGQALLGLGRVAEAEPLLREALDAAHALGGDWIAAFLYQSLAFARSLVGDLPGARAYAAEAMAGFRAVGDVTNAAAAAGNLAEAEFRAGEIGAAIRLAERALDDYGEGGGVRPHATANLAAYLIAADRYDAAAERAREAAALAYATEEPVAFAWALQHRAAVAALRPVAPDHAYDQHVCAARLLGASDARLAAAGAPRQFTEQQEYDRALGALRDLLAPSELADQLVLGAALTDEQALAATSV